MTLSGLKVKEQSLSDFLKVNCLDNDKLAITKTKDFVVMTNLDGDTYIMPFEAKKEAPKEPRAPKKIKLSDAEVLA